MVSFDRSMQKKKLKNIIRSRHFSSCFFILTLLSTILFFVSTLLSIWQNNLQLKEQLEAKADAAYSNMENTFSVMKVGSVFIAKLASVNHILVSPDPTIDYFSRMISDISPYTQLYSFETICLYFDRSERVFDSSGGMYTYSDFYNPDFLQILSEMDTEEAWVVNIPYERYYSPRPAVPVVVYAHSLPLYSSNPKGYITISYAMRELRRDAAALLSDNDNSYHAVVTFCDQLIYATDAALYERWDSSLSADENEALLFPDYNAYPAVQNSNTLQCTYYVSTTEQFKAVTPFLLRRFCEYFFILFCCFLLSAIYSMVLLKPVDDIMEKLGITPYTLGLSDDHDEFFRLNSALDSLTAQVCRGAFRPARKRTARPGASAAWYPPCLCRCHCPASGIYEIRSGLSVPLLFPDPHPHACPRKHGGFRKKGATASRCPLQRFGGIFRPWQSLRHPYKRAEYLHLAQYLHRRCRADGRIKAPLQRYFPTHAADAFH